MESNKKLKSIVAELLTKGRKLNISVTFISKSIFAMLKTIRINTTHYFNMKISNIKELQQVALYHSSDVEFKEFAKLYKDYTKEPFSFQVIHTVLP